MRTGILPAYRTVPHLLPHGYWIIDDEVWFERVAGEHKITDADEVALFNKLTDRLWTVAIEGDEARAFLLRTIERIRP